MIEGMTKLFKVTKTIRFELRPIGKTLENLKKNKTIFKDEKINSDFQQVKLWLDDLHKEYIEKTLQKLSENTNFKEEIKKYEEIHLSNSNQLEKEKKDNSDILIIVVGIFTFSEQKLINKIKTEFKKAKINKPIYIIHNFLMFYYIHIF